MALIPFSYWRTQNNIVTDQLIAHLDAGNPASYPGSGSTWTDLRGNSNATLYGSPVYSSGNGGYLTFTVDPVKYADLNLVGVNSSTTLLTVEMWVKPVDMGFTSGMLFGFNVYDFYQTNSGIGYNTANGDQRGAVLSRIRNEDWWYGAWQHIVVVMHQTSSYTNNKIYINGRLYDYPEPISGSENAGNRTFSDGIMRISGWRNNTSYPVNADIAVFRVYNKELSEVEVDQNFAAERARFGKLAVKPHPQEGCKLYYDFEGENDWYTNSGSYVRDYSRVMQFGNLEGGVGWNSAGGGNMQFRSSGTRQININRASNWFGLYYGSASFVFVFRYISSGTLEYIFHPHNARTYGGDINIRVDNNNLYYSHNTSGEPVITGLSANTWYHVVCTYDYNTYVVQMYLNGSLIVSNGFQERMVQIDEYWLGREDTTTYHDFDLGLFMIYNRVITGTEVTTLYNTQRNRFGI